MFPWIRIGNLLNGSLLLSPRSTLSSGTVSLEEVRYESSPEKAPPPSRRRMMPPTPQQSSYSSIEERQWQTEVEDQVWNARDRTVFARLEQYLDKSDSLNVEVEELSA